MNTNDKTLADVQPGGRVRLGDAPHYWPEVDRILVDAYAAGSEGDEFDMIAARNAIYAALSAQPSPGGKGEANALIQSYDMAVVKFNASLTDDHYSDAQRLSLRGELTAARAALEAALAARQPVGVAFPWENFPAYLIDKCEGDTISEEGLQQALAAMAKDEGYCLPAHQPVGEQPAIPEGWALVDLAEYTVLPQIPTTAMMDAGWPIGEQITDQFDVKGAYADLISEHEAKGEGIIHGPIQVPAQAVDLGRLRAQVADLLRSEFDLEIADPEDHRHDDGSAEADRIAGRIVALIDSHSAGGQP